jgi:hypothetical protein
VPAASGSLRNLPRRLPIGLLGLPTLASAIPGGLLFPQSPPRRSLPNSPLHAPSVALRGSSPPVTRPRLTLRDADTGSLARPGRVRPAECRPHRGSPLPFFYFFFYIGALRAVPFIDPPSGSGRPMSSRRHPGFITPLRRSSRAPALACPRPSDWTAPLFLTNRRSSVRIPLALPSRPSIVLFFPPPLPSSSSNRRSHRTGVFCGRVFPLPSTISGRAISLVLCLFKSHPRRRDKPVRRQPCPPIDVDQRTTARLHRSCGHSELRNLARGVASRAATSHQIPLHLSRRDPSPSTAFAPILLLGPSSLS